MLYNLTLCNVLFTSPSPSPWGDADNTGVVPSNQSFKLINHDNNYCIHAHSYSCLATWLFDVYYKVMWIWRAIGVNSEECIQKVLQKECNTPTSNWYWSTFEFLYDNYIMWNKQWLFTILFILSSSVYVRFKHSAQQYTHRNLIEAIKVYSHYVTQRSIMWQWVHTPQYEVDLQWCVLNSRNLFFHYLLLLQSLTINIKLRKHDKFDNFCDTKKKTKGIYIDIAI